MSLVYNGKEIMKLRRVLYVNPIDGTKFVDLEIPNEFRDRVTPVPDLDDDVGNAPKPGGIYVLDHKDKQRVIARISFRGKVRAKDIDKVAFDSEEIGFAEGTHSLEDMKRYTRNLNRIMGVVDYSRGKAKKR